MFDRFLLYVDLLGFSDLVRNRPEIIPRIFEALDQSPTHHHPAFTAIQFSDTLLVFNARPTVSDYDNYVSVMYLCEFAQHLQQMLLGSNAFIRAIVTYGPLEDSGSASGKALNNVRAV